MYLLIFPDYLSFRRENTEDTFCHFLRKRWKKRCKRYKREAEKDRDSAKRDGAKGEEHELLERK